MRGRKPSSGQSGSTLKKVQCFPHFRTTDSLKLPDSFISIPVIVVSVSQDRGGNVY